DFATSRADGGVPMANMENISTSAISSADKKLAPSQASQNSEDLHGAANDTILNSNAETDQTNPNFSMRKNLQETAFFIPQLHTDETGAVRFTFTMPEALTEWKFIGLAHTTDAKFGQIEGRIKTQKELMV